jgi:hypothetical protein
MSDDDVEGRLEIGARELSRAEAEHRPPLEVVIRDAHRRRRRSVARLGAVALVSVAATIGIVLVAASHASERHENSRPGISVAATAPSSTRPTTTTPPTSTGTSAPTRTLPWIGTVVEPNTRDAYRHTLDATGVHDAPRCALGDLTVTASFGGAGGAEYAGIRVRNRAEHSCFVQGSPYVGLLDVRGRDLGSYPPHQSATDAHVVLLPSSWAELGSTTIGADHCGGPNNDAQVGTTAAAIAFGLEAAETRVVRSDADQATANGCPPSIFSGTYAGSFEAIPDPSAHGSMYDALRDGVALDAPASVRRGETASFSVTVTNTTLNSLPLVDDNCPLYRESLGGTRSGTLLLNCTAAGLIVAPGDRVRFEMRLAVPADQPLGSTTLRWQLVEPGEPALSTPVVVTES